jgi:integrase
MAKTVIVRAICDRCTADGNDGVESVEEVTFSHEGYSYGLDLCGRHAEDFHNTIQALIAASTDRSPVGAARRARSTSSGDGAGVKSSSQPARRDKEQLGAIRDWARANGHKVSDRYRFAHLDGRIGSNPCASTSAGRRCTPRTLAVWIAPSSACSSHRRAARPRARRARGAARTQRIASQRGVCHQHRRPRDRTRSPDAAHLGKGNKPATIPLVPRTARTIDLAVGERHEGPILRRRDGQRLDRRTARRWVRSIGKRAGLGHVHPHMLRAAFMWPPSTLAYPCGTCRPPPGTSDPRTTTIYDRHRQNFDRHAAYAFVAFVAGG